ncbi:Hpt domain-containing protein [Kiloniella sp. EL199]|uniref:Hpt domain-containing protein n=1 Tax=Kiloniella sp. EL199 TaxID=2107581 RepID=UPI0013C420C2|nr:Hpt domain-containing protein [Kiloniella sp. EL199]
MEVKLHMPTNNLKPKVPSEGGPELEDIVAKAEQALFEMEDDYEILVNEETGKIYEFLKTAKSGQGDRAKCIKEIHRIGHNIKGQAATFSYPLLSLAAKSMCHFIQENSEIASERLDLIEAHVNTMRMIIAQKIKGDGGKEGQGLITALEGAVGKILAKE